jgi:hypothetical protein
MGLFLAMSGIVGGNNTEVEKAIRDFAEGRNGVLRQKQLSPGNKNCLTIAEGPKGITILYPDDYVLWDETSEFLSRTIAKPVFSFHIHDGDLWMYQLFANGEVVDRFNPVPDYWEELEEDERALWRGSADAVAKHVPGLDSSAISKYLNFWGNEVLESPERRKAYPDDEFFIGDDWQLVDFMKRLGLTYPIGDNGAVVGATYEYKCR